jgi:hypothetical protein
VAVVVTVPVSAAGIAWLVGAGVGIAFGFLYTVLALFTGGLTSAGVDEE